MQCLKCGREIPVGEVFCQACLEDMAKHPVRPGTPIRIPKHTEPAQVKKQQVHRPAVPPEVRIRRLKRRLWIVSLLLAAVLILSGLGAWKVAAYIWEEEGKPLPGQNYTSTTTTNATTSTEPVGE